MLAKLFRSLSARALVAALCLALSGAAACSGLSGITSSATSDGSGTGSDTGSTGGAEELSATESELYESGPIDLPVTIAKLDGADANLITVEYQDSGITSGTSEGSLVKLLENSEGSGYVITGAAGAVNTEQATKIYGLHTSNGQSVIADVGDDGSFEFSIQAAEGEVIALAPMLEDESQIGTPLYADSENGVTTVALTNSDALNSDQNLVIDGDGYAYFSALASDGTYSLYRKNLDGTEVQTIATGISEQIRFIAVNAGAVTYITQSGLVFNVSVASFTSVSALVKGKPSWEVTSWNEPVQVQDIGAPLDDPEEFIPTTVRVFMSSVQKYYVSNQTLNNINFEGEAAEYLLTYHDPNTGDSTPLMPTADYRTAFFDMGSMDTLYAFVTFSEISHTIDLYRLNMQDGANIWENRTLLTTLPPNPNVLHIDASLGDLVLFTIPIPQGDTLGHEFHVWTGSEDVNNGFSLESDAIVYSEYPVLSPSSTAESYRFVTCATNSETGKSYLVLHRSEDEPGVFYRIIDSETKNGCVGAYTVDEDRRLLFYRAQYAEDGTELAPQLTYIDLDALDETKLVLDE